jgi:hypothetical protein
MYWISFRKGFFSLTVRLPRFVMRQDVFLRLAVQDVDVVISQVDWLYQSKSESTTSGTFPHVTHLPAYSSQFFIITDAQ